MILTVGALRTELFFIRGPKVALGVGERAGGRLSHWLDGKRPAGVLVVGFCGGLRATLPPGTSVLAGELVGDPGARSPLRVLVNGKLLGKAKEKLPEARVGTLVTLDRSRNRPVGPAEKACLGIDALGVDLESAHLARELWERGIPFLVVRIVLDALWEEPPFGARRALWARRAIACARQLGRAAQALSPTLEAT